MANKQKQPEATTIITVDFLQSVSLFSDMIQTEIEQIKPNFFPREFRRKEIIFLKGDPCKELYIIASGQVKLSEISENGREQALFILSRGDSFDMVPIIDGGLYPTTATALNDVMLYAIVKQDMLTIMRAYPTVASAVLPHLGKNLREMADLVADISFESVSIRIAKLILHYADIQGTPTPEGMLVKRTLTHQEIADIVGTEREVVTRSLSDLQKKGIIDMQEGKQILILDEGKLHNK
jgi:CRP/FNR family transcriptional regulator